MYKWQGIIRIMLLGVAACFSTSGTRYDRDLISPSLPTATDTTRPTTRFPTSTPTPKPTAIHAHTYTATPLPGARPACTQVAHFTTSYTEGMLDTYTGSIDDKYPIGMTLVYNGLEVEGVYFYTRYLVDIKLAGCLESGRLITLRAFDASGNLSEIFHGEFPEVDPRGAFGGAELQREVILGTWENVNSSQSLPFYVVHEHSTGGSLQNRYQIAGTLDDEVVEKAAQQFLRAVAADDKARVAGMVAFPIWVDIDGQRRQLTSPDALIDQYDKVFTPAFKTSLEQAVPHNMFSNWQGIMLSSGAIWFDADGKVIAINN